MQLQISLAEIITIVHSLLDWGFNHHSILTTAVRDLIALLSHGRVTSLEVAGLQQIGTTNRKITQPTKSRSTGKELWFMHWLALLATSYNSFIPSFLNPFILFSYEYN